MKNLLAKCCTGFKALGLLTAGILAGGVSYAQQASFSFTTTPGTACAPAVVTFKNTSTAGALSYSWDFDNGRYSQLSDPQVTYTVAGTYHVALTSYYATGPVTFTKDIVVNPLPAPDFSVSEAMSCKAYSPTFTDLTPEGTSRVWDFGDNTGNITTPNATITHNYQLPGVYDVTLSVTNANGCTNTVTKKQFIQIALPTLTAPSPVAGCVPVNATLAVTVSNLKNEAVTAYAWNFGDGQSQTVATPAVQHTYSSTGRYDVTLTVTTQSGCTVSAAYNDLVMAGVAPAAANFGVTPNPVCAGDAVRLVATATGADTYSWDFGDGTLQSGAQNDITHIFQQNGPITVNMSAGSNGCYNSATPVTVQVNGPVASFDFVRDCSNKHQFLFTNTSKEIPGNTYEWAYGDASALGNTQNSAHTYTTPGKYFVRLTLTAGSCSSTAIDTLYDFNPDFSAGVNTVCRGTSATYSVLNVPGPLVANYSWRFADGTQQDGPTLTDVSKVLDQTGVKTDWLVISYIDPRYCNDTVRKVDHISVIAPTADFSLDNTACVGQDVAFINTTVPSPNIPVITWSWDLGNGATADTETPANVVYAASGTYPIKLVITDARTCMDSITRSITINPTPYLYTSRSAAKLCEGDAVTLTASTDATVQWLTNYNLSCTACNTTSATPAIDTIYHVMATNAFGCSVEDSVRMQVVPTVVLSVSSDTAICTGASVQLKAEGATTYSWLPKDNLTDPDTASPLASPPTQTTYTVTGSNDAACPGESKSVTITVNPLPTVSTPAREIVTVGSIVPLNATGSTDVISWQWAPADYIDCTTCQNTNAAVRKPIAYSITGTNSYGCTASAVTEVVLVCDENVVFIPNTFTPNHDGVNDVFYVRGKGIANVRYFRIFNRNGVMVFERNNFNVDDISAGWDGTIKGQSAASDVYVYLVDMVCDNNQPFQLKGNVTLLR
ncbi:gliding motility-associated C-terminal domain-containing protein [Chitinophaga costaii]|uniref:Gliding motility-associated C-terminal domain-containing protein n=1 Tax=Chitinophaga costaii TaxID=1335309 RepID=A0A1C4BZV8_9BACT|nr:PKD domain-containing protein [Chitinophaga costaii]SCC12385.1 gliding motility-associated C-terminal domain-containing protein [Chitinophaga costaii]